MRKTALELATEAERLLRNFEANLPDPTLPEDDDGLVLLAMAKAMTSIALSLALIAKRPA